MNTRPQKLNNYLGSGTDSEPERYGSGSGSNLNFQGRQVDEYSSYLSSKTQKLSWIRHTISEPERYESESESGTLINCFPSLSPTRFFFAMSVDI